jgi:hypothetical protein
MYIEIAPRKRKGAASNRTQAPRASKRSATTRLFEMGAGPDRWGRWKVDHIKEVRRVRGGTRHRGKDRLRQCWRRRQQSCTSLHEPCTRGSRVASDAQHMITR